MAFQLRVAGSRALCSTTWSNLASSLTNANDLTLYNACRTAIINKLAANQWGPGDMEFKFFGNYNGATARINYAIDLTCIVYNQLVELNTL